MHTWEVRDGSGTVIGMNQSAELAAQTPASVSARQIRLWLLGKGVSMSAVTLPLTRSLTQHSVTV
jgi:hypothetical protein